jgi:hypothetical protein
LSGATARGSVLNTDFSEEFPPGMPFGSAYVDLSGGVDNSPCLKLTDGQQGENGWFYFWDLPDYETTGFNAKFKMLIGGGTAPADGLSFNFASDFNYWGPPLGEEGDGTGLTISFDTYDNGGGEAPAIDVKKAGKTIFSKKGNVVELFRTGQFVPVEVNVDAEGTLDLKVNNQVIVSGLKRAFTRSWGLFAFGARAGGLTDNHWVDDVHIETLVGPPALPYVSDVSPSGLGARPDAVIQVKIQDGQSALNESSVQMKVDGALVPATVQREGNTTTVSYDPPGNMEFGKKYLVEVTFRDASANPTTRSELFDFTTLYVRGPNGNYYELVYDPFSWINWPDAKTLAETRTWGGVPGHLATIKDRAEDVFVELVRSVSLPASEPGWRQEVWVGGFQLPGHAPNEGWQWVNNEGPIAGYTNWEPGEPNDGYGVDSENFLTVGLWNEFGWNDSGDYNSTYLPAYMVEYEAIAMPLDFKPGDPNNRVQLNSKGKVNIALLTTPSFDARSVVVSKLTAGRTGVEARPLSFALVDVDGDGDLDLQLQFDLQDLGLRCGDNQVIAFSENSNGAPMRGIDSVQIANCPPYGLTVTALQDVAHKTDVYLTVNSLLAGYTAPTVAPETTFRSFNLSGRQTWNRVVKNVLLTATSATTSVGSAQFNDLSHLQTLTARAQVKNSSNGSTEILNGDAKVLLRPDLQIASVQAPASARTRQSVSVIAQILEANRDLGATCNAYLMSGNTVVDQATGVAISAGGQAVVRFAARFMAPGTFPLRVVLGNVSPGDFDDSNNVSAPAIVEVTDQPLTSASSILTYTHQKSESYEEARTPYDITIYHQKNDYESLNQKLSVPWALQFPISHFSASINVDGVAKRFGETSDIQISSIWEDGCWRYTYGWQFNFNGNNVQFEVVEDLCGGTGETHVEFWTFGNESGYISANYSTLWNVQSMYGSGVARYGTYFLPQTSIGTYLTVDSGETPFGGSAQITEFSGWDFPDQWEYSDGFTTYKGFSDDLMVNGESTGFTQP